MIKTLRPVGNSLGLIIDRPILELLGIDRQTQLRITTDGRVLYIEPIARDVGDQTESSSGKSTPPGQEANKPSADKTSR
jgi:antitoxin component of MazEF toxin-antitoxin module